ncbi:MAG: HAMP domain-containing histidine kinase [Planctomycetes bacterium]|nr:HAMP domain-containing histidine kinase [Planctomycetota bacterium]
MADRRKRTFSIKGPIILSAVVLVLVVTLTVIWNLTLVHDYNKLRDLAVQSGAFHGTMIAVGSVLFFLIIVFACILIFQLIHNIRWAQRQSEFIATVSHELNSPLASIKLFAQTLRSDRLSREDHEKFVDRILTGVERLSHIISNILRAAEVEHGRGGIVVTPERVELTNYIEEFLEQARDVFGPTLDVTFTTEGECWVDIDPVAFRQVLENLLDNAVRYRSGDRAEVEVRLETRGERWELLVSDRGIGVQRSDLKRIFDRFYRSESEAGRRPGMGIGLNVVRSIVTGHGGHVVASSAGPGHGLAIQISLPRGEAAEVGA